MMAALIDRKRLKADTRTLLAGAFPSAKAMTALYLGIILLLDLVTSFTGETGLIPIFISMLVVLLALVLKAGYIFYCMDIRNGEETSLLTLFDGFSLVGKLIGLEIVCVIFISLWSMLFVIPGIVAGYRYRFALLNLLENPSLGIFEALNMSKRQTMGYKIQLFVLDLSYIGWHILADLPATLYSSYIQIDAVISTMSIYALEGLEPALAMPAGLPLWGWLLVTGIWNLVVSLFYLPHSFCVELGYFQIAKETSGIGGRPADPYGDDPDPTNGFY